VRKHVQAYLSDFGHVRHTARFMGLQRAADQLAWLTELQHADLGDAEFESEKFTAALLAA